MNEVVTDRAKHAKPLIVPELMHSITVSVERVSLTLQKLTFDPLRSSPKKADNVSTMYVPVPTSIAPLGIMQVVVGEETYRNKSEHAFDVEELLCISLGKSEACICLISNSMVKPGLDAQLEISQRKVTNIYMKESNGGSSYVTL